MQRRVLIAGCGYLGVALGRRLVEAGHRVHGVRRPGADPSAMLDAGIVPLFADLSRPGELAQLPTEWDWVVQCTAPAERSPEGYRHAYLAVAEQLVAWLSGGPVSACAYVGSTSVYGPTEGGEVDENAATEPGTATGEVLLATEGAWGQAVASDRRVIRLRAAGIYGPGRNRLGALRRGEARRGAGEGRWMNLIHVDDLAGAVEAALEQGRTGQVYNVSDGSAVREREFYDWLCRRTGLPLPLKEDPTAGEGVGRRARRGTDKRIVARRLGEQTGWSPHFPSFREGYEDLFRGSHPEVVGPS